MKPKTERGKRFEENIDLKAAAKWHHNFDRAMFGSTEVNAPHEAEKQLGLEKRPDDIKKAAQAVRRITMLGEGTITIENTAWQVSLAADPADLAQGLAGLASLPAGTGEFFDLGMDADHRDHYSPHAL